MNEKIAVGQVVNCVGTRGEIKIFALTDNVKRFLKLRSVWIGHDENNCFEYHVEAVRLNGTHVVLRLRGLGTRKEAECLKRNFVYVAMNNAITPPEGSYFIHEVIGLLMSTVEGRNVGVVKDVWRLPAHDVWVVNNGNKEILIPAVKEIVRNVDVNQRSIVINDMEGLFD